MINIAVVEDEAAAQVNITEYIKRYFSENNKNFKLHVFSDGDEVLDGYKAVYDIIFLDIQMRRLDGLKTAKLIRELDEDVLIIFITNMIDYAVKGYSVNALDFMVKPVNYFSMEQQLIKAVNILTKKKRRYVTIPTGKGLSRLDASVITYIESYSHKLIIHSEKGEFPLNETMRNMELLFADYGFYRCNNSYLVNLNFTERVENNIVFVAGNKLIISRPKRKAFMEALVKYIGEVKG